MKIDRRWRSRIESLRRAGIDYLPRDRAEESPPAPILREIENNVAPRPKSANTPPIRSEPLNAAPPPASSGFAASPPESPILVGAAKLEALAVLRNEVASCIKCAALAPCRTNTVFSDGSPAAEICFVGEAPGHDEDQQGVPFVGKAGQLLTKIIEACKLRREEVYICNVLKCRPPDNRNPMPDEVENCRGFLDRQLAMVRPKILIALGKFAAASLLGENPERVFITKIRGQIREYRGIPLMITLHPAYLLRNPSAKRDVWDDMKAVMRRLGRPVD